MKNLIINLYQLIVRILLVLLFGLSLAIIFVVDDSTVEQHYFIAFLALKIVAFILIAFTYYKMKTIGMLRRLSDL